MTINELRNAVKVELDKTSSLDLPAFEDEEIDYWLTLSAKRIREDRYNKFISGDNSVKLQLELGNLYHHMQTFTISSFVDSTIGAGKLYECTVATTPQNFVNGLITDFYVLSLNKVLLDGSTIASYWQKCKYVTERELADYLSSSNNYRYFENPVYTNVSIYTSEILTVDILFKICTDYFTSSIGTSIKVSYISPVTEINTTNFPLGTEEYYDVPTHLQHNIVTLAKDLMLENIESQRLQTSLVIDNKEE